MYMYAHTHITHTTHTTHYTHLRVHSDTHKQYMQTHKQYNRTQRTLAWLPCDCCPPVCLLLAADGLHTRRALAADFGLSAV